MQAFLIKAGDKGEGSRGGKIIGHTSSSKPIYEHHPAYNAARQKPAHSAADGLTHFPRHTGKDHAESADAHITLANKYVSTNIKMANHHMAAAGVHHEADNALRRKALKKLSPAGALVKKSFTEKEDDMQAFLIKAGKGEGSRGGHIIGHTKNGGHPIYASTAATSRKYSDLGANDHVHARDMHKELAEHFAAKAKQSGISDEEKQHARASASNHRKQSQGHARKYAEMFGHYRNALTNGAMAAGASHKAPSNKAKEKAYLEGQDKVSAARAVYDGKPFKKSLDALHPSDGLHQMGAQFAQKHPEMSASDHMAASQKYAKAGQPHMAIGHMMASSYKSAVAKKSSAANRLIGYFNKGSKNTMGKSLAATVLEDFLSKANPVELGKTQSGKTVYGTGAPVYRGVKSVGQAVTGPNGAAKIKANVKAVRASHPDWSAQDHHDAAALHSPYNESPHVNIDAGVAHYHAARVGRPGALVKKSLSKAGKGEGSRGGKIIGHTKSGKPIYGSDHAMYGSAKDLKAHTKGWSHDDHWDARRAHDKQSSGASEDHHVASWAHEGMTGESGYRSSHETRGDKHDAASELHRRVGYALKSMAANVLRDYLSKADTYGTAGSKLNIGYGVKRPTTGSGKRIPSPSSKAYKPVSGEAHDADFVAAAHSNGAAIKPHFAGWSAQDHHDAAAHHEDSNYHHIAGAHFGLAGHYGARKTKADRSFNKSLSKAGGEGSRGGHIIGHTKSGKPIYSAAHDSYSGIQNLASQGASMGGHGRAARDAHPKYSKQDHADASYAHHLEGQKEGGARGFGLASANASHAHHAAFNQMRSRAAAATRDVKKSQADLIFTHTSENPDKSMVYFTDLSKAARNPMSTTLGHTTSGKPVRGDSGHHAPNLGFSKQDHGEAADFHMAAAQKISKKPFTQANQSTYNMHRIAHQMHMIHQKKMDKSLAGLHECESLSMFTLSKAGKTGEGSRGGKIIGHTKSGRPVYAADHADYAEPIRVRSINGGGQIPLTHHHLQGNVRAAHSLRGRRQDMTSQDHLDAAGIHASHAVKQQALHKKIFNSPKNLRQPGDDPHILAVSGPHSHLKESARNKAFAAIDSGRLSEAAAHLHMHAAKLAKRGEKANGGGVKKSFASHGFSKAEKGEGSRGGKIIGHTKSGKPIYGASHSDYHTAANKKGQSISESLVMPKGGFKGSAVKPIVDATLAMHRGWDSQDHHDAAQAHGKGHHALTVGDAHRFTAELLERREHNARINKRLKEKDGGQTIKSVAHGFNDMLKASGITMWAPKDEPAAPLALN